jgi:hypothetical protein
MLLHLICIIKKNWTCFIYVDLKRTVQSDLAVSCSWTGSPKENSISCLTNRLGLSRLTMYIILGDAKKLPRQNGKSISSLCNFYAHFVCINTFEMLETNKPGLSSALVNWSSNPVARTPISINCSQMPSQQQNNVSFYY